MFKESLVHMLEHCTLMRKPMSARPADLTKLTWHLCQVEFGRSTALLIVWREAPPTEVFPDHKALRNVCGSHTAATVIGQPVLVGAVCFNSSRARWRY